MANVYLQDSTLTAIGNAIRTKGGTTAQLLPSEMPAAITNLPSGGGAPEIDYYNLSVSKNATYYMWKDWNNIITDFSKVIQFTYLFGRGSIMVTINQNNSYTTSGDTTTFNNVTGWMNDGGFLTAFHNIKVVFIKGTGVGIYNSSGSQFTPSGSTGAISLSLAKG